MIAALCLAATSKVRSRFSFLPGYTVRNGVVNFWHIFETSFPSTPSALKKSFFYRPGDRAHLKVPITNWVLTFVILFYGNNRRRKISSRKKYRIYKVFIFFVSRIYCLVFLIEVLKLKLRYGFVENFTALLLKREFVSSDLRNKSGSKNTETEFTVNFYFLWSIFLSL